MTHLYNSVHPRGFNTFRCYQVYFSVLEKVRSKRQKHVVVVDSDGSEVEDDSDEEAEEQERVKMAAEYKDQGNEHFKNGNFTEAVNCYTMAQE